MPLDEHQIAQFQAEFQRVTTELQAGSKSALDEARRLGDMHADTKQSVDKLLTEQGTLKAALDEMAASTRALEQRVSARRGGGEAGAKSFGTQVAEHEDMKALAARGGVGSARFELQAAITSISTSGGALIAPARDTNVAAQQRRLTIRDLVSQGETTSTTIQFARQQPTTGKASIVPDDGVTAKPELGMSWVADAVPVATIAGWIHVHKHMLDDVAFLRSEIDTELRYQVDLEEEAQLLAGDGTLVNGVQNMRGLITAASAYNQTAREPGGVTAIDRLRLAMLQVSLARYVVDAHVLNPIDWALMEILKDSQARYIFGDPTQAATPRLWGRPVVDSPAMPEDKFLTGAFKLAATYYERQGTVVLASSEDRDNFIKNMVTVLAEKRGALAVKRPTALVYGDFGRVA